MSTKTKGEREPLLTCVLNADLQRKVCIADCINSETKPKKLDQIKTSHILKFTGTARWNIVTPRNNMLCAQ